MEAMANIAQNAGGTTAASGILIVFEMTHEFALVPALMIGALASQMVARRFTRGAQAIMHTLRESRRLSH